MIRGVGGGGGYSLEGLSADLLSRQKISMKALFGSPMVILLLFILLLLCSFCLWFQVYSHFASRLKRTGHLE